MADITIREVAKLAGVSLATVSRVLNTNDTVAVELRDRVRAAVAELGYRPNNQARSLRRSAIPVLGIIVPDITDPSFALIVRGFEDAANEAGYSVMLANTDEDVAKEERYLEVVAAERMAGVALVPASATRTRVDMLAGRAIPVVTIERRLRGVDVDSVSINNQKAAREVVTRLLGQGCKRIGFIGGPLRAPATAARIAGYRAGLRAAGLDVDEQLIEHGNNRVDGGRLAALRLLALSERPDAVFVANDLMTLGVMEALSEAGLRVPADVVVACFDGTGRDAGSLTPLTVVRQPTYELGRRAADILLRRARGERFPRRRVVLRAEVQS